jgi:hypothetical protein
MAPKPTPLAKMSKRPKLVKAGLYVDGGISEYSLAFTRPIREFLRKRNTAEPVIDYVTRIAAEKGGEARLRELAHAGIPSKVREKDSRRQTARRVASERQQGNKR